MKPAKTAYEIRQELLSLAFEILREQHAARAVAAASERGMEYVHPTTSPTVEEVIAEAQKLNSFVSTEHPKRGQDLYGS